MTHFFTIVLNGMPWISCHLPVFNKLNVDWRWHVIEGAAKNVGCTSWCKSIPPSLSTDGTTEYLNEISSHPRVRLYRSKMWNGKLDMVNAFAAEIKAGDTVMEGVVAPPGAQM